MNIHELILKVESLLRAPVYLVGGSVRDDILGLECNDYDFATSLTPDEIESRIREYGRKPFLVGKRFGTIGMKLDDLKIEITTFRAESYEKNNRKPNVQFVNDLIADLSRRDFTINAMALSSKKLVDPFKGQEDLQKRVIRTVGNPTIRFKEDPLRMLRACRFSSQFGFEIEAQTFKKMKAHAQNILNVSKERWVMEIDKLLMGDHVKQGLFNLWKSDLIKFMIPELHLQYEYDQKSKYHPYKLHEHTAMVVEACPKDINLRWAAFLHDVAKPFCKIEKEVFTEDEHQQMIAGTKVNYPQHERLGKEFAIKIGRYLKFSNERLLKVSEIIANHLNDDCVLRHYDNLTKKNLEELQPNVK
jgi:tRNA nucleotidyltransferase (CCA-adding enzyme)